MNNRALRKAVKKAGSQTKLASKLSEITGKDVKQQNVWRWLNSQRPIPGEWAIPIERAVDGEVKRHDLRPDLYPIEAAQ